MKVVNRLLAGIMITAGAALCTVTMSTSPAQATLAQTGVCPSDLGHVPEGGGGAGSATDCNGLITFGANNSISTSFGPQTNYDSIEDALIRLRSTCEKAAVIGCTAKGMLAMTDAITRPWNVNGNR